MTATGRELEVFWWFLHTGSQQEAAGQLGLTLSTVKNHTHSLYGKLDVTNAYHAAAKLGWLALPGVDVITATAHALDAERRLRAAIEEGEQAAAELREAVA